MSLNTQAKLSAIMTRDYEDPMAKINPEELKKIEQSLELSKTIEPSKPKNISEFEKKYFLRHEPAGLE